MPACLVYPLILQATEATIDFIVEFCMPASFAVALKRAIMKRFNETQSARILKLLYFSTPQGRKFFRENSGGTPIHGEDACALDESIIPSFHFDEKDMKLLDTIREDWNANEDVATQMKGAFASYTGKLIDPLYGKKCRHVAMDTFNEDSALSAEDIAIAVDDPEFKPTYDSFIPDETDIEDDTDEEFISDSEIDDLDWVKENNAEDRNYIHHEDVATETEEEETNDSEYDSDSDDYSDYDTDDDEEQNEDIEITSEGNLHDCFAAINEICKVQGKTTSTTDAIKTYFNKWLTAAPEEIIPEQSMLNLGASYWETLCSNPKHKIFAEFIVPLFSLSASEAIVERVFWFQRRVLGDVSMGMSPEVEKARLNSAIIGRQKM